MEIHKINYCNIQDLLSPQSSQSWSSYLSQSSLIRSPPPSSLLRSNLLSVRILSQSTSSQPLSATAALFNPKRQFFFAKFSDWSTKSKTLTASPRFLRYFSSSLKTNSHHMLSAKSTNSITSPNSGSSSTDTLQSSQLKFQPPSNIPLPFLSTATSWCTPTFPSSPTPATHSLYFYSSIYILPSSRT